MKTLLIKTHELWLETLMASFMSSGDNRMHLYEFANIIFRHFTWIENQLIKNGESYNYDRDHIPIKVEKLSVILQNIDRRMSDLDLQLMGCTDTHLSQRVSSDIKYIKRAILGMHDEAITAFNSSRKLNTIKLTPEATDALTLFLFEESYKEYELIMIYNYLKAHSSDAFINRIYQIMIDESQFHLRSFGNMMAEMGILGVPRVIHKSLYEVEDITQFLLDGIDEEMAAKEMCKELSDAVAKDSKELAHFFDFINLQEDYHISLMREALEHYKQEGADV